MEPSSENLAHLHRERMARARRMSPEQKLTAGPELFSLAIESMRAGIRLTHPEADENQIRTLLHQRLARQRHKDERPFHAAG